MARDLQVAPPMASALSRRRIRKQRARFDPALHGQLVKMAQRSDRLRDLTHSFPALAAALAGGYGCAVGRAKAVASAIAGAPLKEAAAAAGVPMWMRRLPPEAFRAPLAPMIDPPDAARRLAAFAPQRGAAAAIWLAWTTRAYELRGLECAVWIARQTAFFEALCDQTGAAAVDQEVSDLALDLILARLFAMENPQTLVGMLTSGRWTPKASFARIAGGVGPWVDRIFADLSDPVADDRPGWLSAVGVGDFWFYPLLTYVELAEEGATMAHCVGGYWIDVELGRLAVYSVRLGAERIATLAVADVGGRAQIVELYGARNEVAPDGAWRAAESFVAAEGFRPLQSYDANRFAMGAETWAEIWAPFLEAVADMGVATFFKGMKDGDALVLAAAVDLLKRAANGR